MKRIITHKITQSLSLVFLGFLISIPILTFFNTNTKNIKDNSTITTENSQDIKDNSTITTENTKTIIENSQNIKDNSQDIKNLQKKSNSDQFSTTQPSINKE